MSHDRGCPCGREKYEYDECKDPKCMKKRKKILSPSADALKFWKESYPLYSMVVLPGSWWYTCRVAAWGGSKETTDE